MEGGVFGAADVPFVDFHGTTFNALDVTNTFLSGTLQVTAIPEPSTVFLVGIGLALITVRAKRFHAQT